MKKLISFFIAMMLTLSLLIFNGCKEKGVDIIIYDYETQDKIATLNSVEDTKNFKDFSGAFLSLGEVATGVEENGTYSVLLKDPKDSTYDIWYKVALSDGCTFARFDFEKMDDEYVSTFNEMAFTEDYCKCDNMSDEMFKEFLE